MCVYTTSVYDLCVCCRGVCTLWQRAERTEEECVSPSSLFLKTGSVYLSVLGVFVVVFFCFSLLFSPALYVYVLLPWLTHMSPPSLWQQPHVFSPPPSSPPPSVEEKSLLFITHLCIMLLCDAGSLLFFSVCVMFVMLMFVVFSLPLSSFLLFCVVLRPKRDSSQLLVSLLILLFVCLTHGVFLVHCVFVLLILLLVCFLSLLFSCMCCVL